MPSNILIADSSSLAAAGARAILASRLDTCVEVTDSVDDLLQYVMNQPPDLLLLGHTLDPDIDCLTLVGRLLTVQRELPVAVVGDVMSGRFIRDLLLSGVQGYLFEADDLVACLTPAVDTLLRGKLYLSPTANAEYLALMQGHSSDICLDAEARGVLRLLTRGYSVGRIAAQLTLRPRRVYWIREKLRTRFGAETNEHLISLAAAEGYTCTD